MILGEAVRAPCSLSERVHRCLHDPRDGEVVGIRCFTSLEEHVRVLRSAPHVGCVGVHPPAAELDDFVVVDERGHVLAREQGDLCQLMGSPESVEEVEERYT